MMVQYSIIKFTIIIFLVNRSGISIGMGTINTNRFYNYENSMDTSRPHVTFNDEDQ